MSLNQKNEGTLWDRKDKDYVTKNCTVLCKSVVTGKQSLATHLRLCGFVAMDSDYFC